MKAAGLVLSRALLALPLLALAGIGSAESGKPPGQFLGAMPTEYPDWFKDSFLELADDVAEAGESGRRVVLLFHQDGCPYCNALVERNLAQKSIEAKVRQHFDVIALNMWGDREVATVAGETLTEKQFAAALRVQFTPTLVFLGEDGNVALRLNGYVPPAEFSLALDYVAGRMEGERTFQDFLAENRPPSSGGELVPAPFFMKPPFALERSRNSKPLAVFFEQRDCPDCVRLHREVLSVPETQALLERFDAVQLDMWAETPVITPGGERTDARAWARSLGVAYAPTIVFFDASDGEVIRSEAMFRQFHTQSMLDYVATRAHRTEPSFQRYISERAEHLREQGIDVDIWR